MLIGTLVGFGDGKLEGLNDGLMEGFVPLKVGVIDGTPLTGVAVGSNIGKKDGEVEGLGEEGVIDGIRVDGYAVCVGIDVGQRDGSTEGPVPRNEGKFDGKGVDGTLVGPLDGIVDGEIETKTVGIVDGPTEEGGALKLGVVVGLKEGFKEGLEPR